MASSIDEAAQITGIITNSLVICGSLVAAWNWKAIIGIFVRIARGRATEAEIADARTRLAALPGLASAAHRADQFLDTVGLHVQSANLRAVEEQARRSGSGVDVGDVENQPPRPRLARADRAEAEREIQVIVETLDRYRSGNGALGQAQAQAQVHSTGEPTRVNRPAPRGTTVATQTSPPRGASVPADPNGRSKSAPHLRPALGVKGTIPDPPPPRDSVARLKERGPSRRDSPQRSARERTVELPSLQNRGEASGSVMLDMRQLAGMAQRDGKEKTFNGPGRAVQTRFDSNV